MKRIQNLSVNDVNLSHSWKSFDIIYVWKILNSLLKISIRVCWRFTLFNRQISRFYIRSLSDFISDRGSRTNNLWCFWSLIFLNLIILIWVRKRKSEICTANRLQIEIATASQIVCFCSTSFSITYFYFMCNEKYFQSSKAWHQAMI